MKLTLKESQLRNIIKEALNELDWKTYANAAKKADSNGEKSRALKFSDSAIKNFNKQYGYDTDNASLKLISAYDDDWNTFRYEDENGNPLSPLDAYTPHTSLHYSYNDGTKKTQPRYMSLGKASSDLENDGDGCIVGSYDAYAPESNGFGMRTLHSDYFPTGINDQPEFVPNKFKDKNKIAFNEFDNYRKGNYKFDGENGWTLKDNTELSEAIKRSIRKILKEGNYNLDAYYHGPEGNRSQYAPDDGDAPYCKPGELSLHAQSKNPQKRKYGQNKKFASKK